jgi:hypothetical protein
VVGCESWIAPRDSCGRGHSRLGIVAAASSVNPDRVGTTRGRRSCPCGRRRPSSTAAVRQGTSFDHKARRSPPSLSPRKERKRGVERSRRQVNLAIPSPLPVLLPLEKGLRALPVVPDHSIERPGQRLSRCPSTLPVPPSPGRGLEARTSRLGEASSSFAKHDARPQVSPLERGEKEG